MYAQSYDELWTQVYEAQNKDLPQTVVTLTEQIFAKAQQEKDSPQMLKAYMTAMDYRQLVTPDSFNADLQGLEQWAATSDVALDRMILHTILANLYSDIASKKRAADNEVVLGETPGPDPSLWSVRLLADTVLAHSRLALEDTQLLIRTPSGSYKPLVEQGYYSMVYGHDMYHLVVLYNVEALDRVDHAINNVEPAYRAQADTLLQRMVEDYRAAGRRDGEFVSRLRMIQRKLGGSLHQQPPYDPASGSITETEYWQQILTLIRQYEELPVVTEGWMLLAKYASDYRLFDEVVRVADKAIAAWPDYPTIRYLQDLRKYAMCPELSMNMPGVVYPGMEASLNVSFRNLREVTVQYSRLNPKSNTEMDILLAYNSLQENFRNFRSETFQLSPSPDYAMKDTVLQLPPLTEGVYAMRVIHPDQSGNPYSQLVYVSALQVLTLSLPDKQMEAIVVDSRTGHPIEGAAVRVYRYNDPDNPFTAVTGANGRVTFGWNNSRNVISAQKGEDLWLPGQNFWHNYTVYDLQPGALDNPNSYQVSLFTDRTLYRPGQTVYVKGIAYLMVADTAQVRAGISTEMMIQSPDRQWSQTQQVTTNEWGSFTTSFVIPESATPGVYNLSTGARGGTIQIRVEEYKRPTFALTFDTPEGSWQLGDSLSVSGEARTLSGVALTGSPVSYTVSRSRQWGWLMSRMNTIVIRSGSVVPDDQGRFEIPVRLEAEPRADLYNRDNWFYFYEIRATYTSPSGETQETTTSLRAGNRSLLLSAELPVNILKEKPQAVTVSATNLSGVPQEVTGKYALYPALPEQPSDRPVADQRTYATDAVATGTFIANREQTLSGWGKLPSGYYRLLFTANDQQGREVTLEKEILLFSASDSRPPVKSMLWYAPLQTEFDAAQPASFLIGTSEADACLLMDVFSGTKRLESRTICLTDSLLRFDYPYQESYGNGLTLSFLLVRGGQLYTQTVQLTRRMTPKKLEMRWETFRDKLRPGQEETWRLKVIHPNGKPADAELLALMYDGALDQIWPNNQQWNLPFQVSTPSLSVNSSGYRQNYFNLSFRDCYSPGWDIHYDGLLWDRVYRMGDSFMSYSSYLLRMSPAPMSRAGGPDEIRIRGMSSRNKDISVEMGGEVMYSVAESSLVFEEEAMADTATGGGETLPAFSGLRTHFNETAFFYPQLHTDANGEVTFTFTLPESLTAWHFRGFAHTREMMGGMLSATAVASKEFMVMTNLPRFVRTGDETAFAATLANLMDKAQTGRVTFTLFDPQTERVIHTESQPFSVGAGENIGVDFRFTAGSDRDLLGCRIVAEGRNFSDGEQHLLPVLPSRESVIETLSIPIRGGQTREFALDTLFNSNSPTATDRRLTVEFSGNPAWYAVQALPSLSQPREKDALSLASAWYANSLASYILQRYPRMQQILEAWRKSGQGKEDFLSNLQKNEELKNVLLSESPWMLEAQTEAEQMQRLSTLFDLNQVRSNNEQWIANLKKLQNSEGAWSWYDGMWPNRYVTLGVMESFIRWQLLTGQEPAQEIAPMQKQGWSYLHRELLREYNEWLNRKTPEQQFSLSSFVMQYLYLVALARETVPADNKKAYQEMLNVLAKMTFRQDVTGKARAAVALQGSGRKKEAAGLVQSLNEYLVQSDSRGAFFAFNESRASWWGQAVPAHVIAMEAIDRVTGNAALIEEMKIWLLAQKQTHQWRTPVATVNAVYALLYRGSDNPLDNQGDVRITLGSRTLHTLSGDNATTLPPAYIKETYTERAEIDRMRKVVVEKADPGFAWGAIYAQYQEDISKVSAYGEGLQVEKRLYVERYEASERTLLAISEGTTLQVGDRVVCRLTLRVDRPMDFVQLVDQRAACFEPADNISGYRRGSNVSYFTSVRDASTRFFFDSLGQGVYTIEHILLVNRAGSYESGLATLQSAYAPEFAAHAPSIRIAVEK